jgi:hypothetical protein
MSADIVESLAHILADALVADLEREVAQGLPSPTATSPSGMSSDREAG